MYDVKTEMIKVARNSFTGKMLTNSQFTEALSVAGIMHRNIRKTGRFSEKLTDYAHAFARQEKFDALRGETIIRDIFKARYAQTMNQMREEFMTREADLPESQTKEFALEHAKSIEPLICDGETMPFYQAYDQAGHRMAKALDITEAGAKRIMKETYHEATGKDLYETGKALEKLHHEPKREAAREATAQTRSANSEQTQTSRRGWQSYRRM